MKKKKSIVSERLREVRELKRMSQIELADKAGLPASTISFYESGSRVPSASSLSRLAVSLNVTTDYLLGTSNEMSGSLRDSVPLPERNVRAGNQPRYVAKPLDELIFDLSLFSSGVVSDLIARVKDISVGVASYQQSFSRAAKERELVNNKKAADTLHLLYIICDFWLQAGEGNKPFRPRSWIGNSRSPIPEDLSETQLEGLHEAVQFITDPLMCARIFDVLWVRLKKVNYAQSAIKSYLESSKISGVMELERFWSLERAIRLSILINSSDLKSECLSAFNNLRGNKEVYDLISFHLLSLAYALRLLDLREIASEARRLAQTYANSDPHRLKDFYELAAAIYKKLEAHEDAKACYSSIGEAFEGYAKVVDALSAGNFLEEAIAAYRAGKASRTKIEELNRLLIDRGRETLGGMKLIESPKIDFSEAVKSAKEFVRGLSAIEALRRVAFQFKIPSYDKLKADVDKSMQESPLRFFIAATSISAGGRQYSRRPSFMTDDPKLQQIAYDTEISALMAIEIEAMIRFCLIPALEDVYWTTADFSQLLNIIEYRPIVPPNRSHFFFVGIKAGLERDFLAAAHILIPQLENSLRFLLEARGKVVTSVNSDSLHNEMSLNKLFEDYRGELSEFFGSKDLVYLMESFLCNKSGLNIRNELCHGLMSNPYDYRYVFVWWLCVYLLFLMKFPDSSDQETDLEETL